MKYIFLFFTFLLIFYNFETLTLLSSNKNSSIVILWKITENKYLFHILPHNIYVLLENDNFYLYLENENEETYISAINIKTNYKVSIVNYMYLREWTDFGPKIIRYSNSLTDMVEIINSTLL